MLQAEKSFYHAIKCLIVLDGLRLMIQVKDYCRILLGEGGIICFKLEKVFDIIIVHQKADLTKTSL